MASQQNVFNLKMQVCAHCAVNQIERSELEIDALVGMLMLQHPRIFRRMTTTKESTQNKRQFLPTVESELKTGQLTPPEESLVENRTIPRVLLRPMTGVYKGCINLITRVIAKD